MIKMASLISICLLCTVISAGLVVQAGVVIGPIATQFGVHTTEVGSQFSFLTGGFFIGTILSFKIFDYISYRSFFLIGFGLLFATALLIAAANTLVVFSTCLAVLGTLAGISLCAAGSIIAQSTQGKLRQSILIAQDASYNLAGALFPLLASYSLAHKLGWGGGYVAVGFVGLLAVLIVLFSRISLQFEGPPEAEAQRNTHLSFEFGAVGLCLFLMMLAQVSLVTWLPQFAEQKLAISSQESGKLISDIYQAALVSALLAIYIVYKVRVQYFLYFVISLSLVSIAGIALADNYKSLSLFCSLLGVSFSASFNSLIAYGLLFVLRPNQKNITTLLLMSSFGVTIGPYLSSKSVLLSGGPSAAIHMAWIGYLGVFLLLLTILTKGVLSVDESSVESTS